MISLWTIDVGLATGSAAVLGVLLGIYLRTYRRVATAFGFSLLVFTGLLLAQNLFAVYAYLSLQAENYKADVALPMMVLNAAELAAFVVLLRTAWD